MLLLGAGSSRAQTADRKQVYEAYVKRDVNSWKRVIDRMHAEPTKSYAGVGEQTQAETWYRKVISLEPRMIWALDSKYLENKQKRGQH